MVIAVDFDGTIVEHKYPAIGKELPGAIATLKLLQEDGHKIILWTVREGRLLDEALQFCQDRNLQFYAVNADKPGEWKSNVTRKLRADIFIDDSNVGGLPEWDQIYEMIHSRKTWGDLIAGAGIEKSGRKKKKGPLRRLIDRCKKARYNLGAGEGYSSHNRHHW